MKTEAEDQTILYGLPEGKDETRETLETIVNQGILKESLELNQVEIKQIHRLGRPTPGKTPSVIFKLLDSRQKDAILKDFKKHEDTSSLIEQDFSCIMREVIKKALGKRKSKPV